MTTTAIPATTAQAVSGSIVMAATDMMQVFTNLDLRIGETVRLEITPDDGKTWYEVVDDTYRGVVLRDTVKNQTVGGPGTYRLNKSATQEAIAVYFDI
jgi:hypothetical protein